MRTKRKQFPVKWLLPEYSARQSEAGSTNEKNGSLSGGNEVLAKTFTQTVPLQAKVEMQLKRPRDRRFCWNSWKKNK